MDIYELFVLMLATWRLSNLLVDAGESGPFNLLHKIRYAAGVRYDDYSQPYGTNEVARALTCLWCTSVWIGALVTAVYALSPLVLWLLLPFALSAGAILVAGFANGGRTG